MEVKEAVAKLRTNLDSWKRCRRNGHFERILVLDSAIPVAETLLAALEDFGKEIDPRKVEMVPALRCVECGALIHPSALFCPSCVRADRPPKPPVRPPTLAGRTVDGEGWKAFVIRNGQLHSEMYGRGRRISIPENQWLDYQDWHEGGDQPDYPFHILRDEEVARRWACRPRFAEAPRLTIRRVGWCKLRQAKPNYVDADFRGDILSAEEIYILPEEGSADPWTFHYHAPAAPPPERPPGKGDWVVHTNGFFRGVRRIDGFRGKTETQCGHLHLITDNLRIVRRAADPLRVGDKVAFGSKDGSIIEVSGKTFCRVNFTDQSTFPKAPERNHGYFKVQDLTLVEPVYDRPAEKGDC